MQPVPCGNASSFCPSGSVSPRPIPAGYYGTGGSDFKLFSGILKCPAGSFCQQGHKFACLAGYYGDSEGLTVESCTGLCPAGWFCPAGTTSKHMYPCMTSPEVYCPTGSSRQVRVDDGYYAIDSHFAEGGGFGLEAICPSGSYCQRGVRGPCPGGRYGATKQMMNESCSGACKAGWFCPAGSISSTQHPCGGRDVYCPESSQSPLPVPIGHFSIGEEEEEGEPEGSNLYALNRLGIEQCAPGYYCAGGK